MRAWSLRLVVPAYLLLCILIGGSVQGVWRVMVLQLIAVALIGWAAAAPKKETSSSAMRALFVLAAISLSLIALQLIPLPPGVWTSLPGRDVVVAGYASLGYPQPWLPVSLAPYETLSAALTLMPPIAVLAAMAKLQAYEDQWIAAALILGMVLNVLLGALQSIGGPAAGAWWYLYEHTNTGAVGFFANSNHLGTLLLAAIPFAMALIASGTLLSPRRGRRHALLALGIASLLISLVGIALNQSLAAIVLVLPVIAFSALVLPGDWRRRRLIVALAALVTILAVLAYTSSPLAAELTRGDSTSLDTRLAIWATGWAAFADSFPFGTGFGSFEQYFRLYETASGIGPIFVNHAHNDYLELLIEGGLPALLLLIAFFFWWAKQAVQVWRSPASGHFARTATIVSGAILAHSLVDFPLRTAAIATLFAACLAMMARRPPRKPQGSADVRPTKHLKIG